MFLKNFVVVVVFGKNFKEFLTVDLLHFVPVTVGQEDETYSVYHEKEILLFSPKATNESNGYKQCLPCMHLRCLLCAIMRLHICYQLLILGKSFTAIYE